VSADPDLSQYRLLASALAGRSVELARHRERLPQTFSDGSTIWVPAAHTGDDLWREIAVQACLIAAGALAPSIMRRLLGRTRLARRYLCLEAVRSVQARAALAPDALLASAAFQDISAQGDRPEASLQIALSTRLVAAPEPLFGVLMPARVLRAQRTEHASSAAAAAPARSKARTLRTRDPEPPGQQSRLLSALQLPFARAGSLVSDLLDQIFERAPAVAGSAAKGATGEGDVEGSVAAFSAFRAGAVRVPERDTLDASIRAHGRSRSYPEWNERRQCYRHNHTHVAEVDPSAEGRARALPRAGGATRRLTRRMARLCLEYEPRRHQIDGDTLTLDDLVRLCVDTRAGHQGDARIYTRSLRTRRDLGVLILLDMTGSSRESGPSGVPIFHAHSEVAQHLTEALYESGERVALYGFHSWGRTLVRMQRIKAFDDRLDNRVRTRLAQAAPVGYSRLGAAIRHGDHMLRTRAGTDHRLLVLISDALAYDRDYEGSYARADTRRALLEARALGTACLCLHVGGDMDDGVLTETFGRSYLRVAANESLDRPLVRAIARAVAEVRKPQRSA
jgi:nitric oxide reductase NorD protein